LIVDVFSLILYLYPLSWGKIEAYRGRLPGFGDLFPCKTGWVLYLYPAPYNLIEFAISILMKWMNGIIFYRNNRNISRLTAKNIAHKISIIHLIFIFSMKIFRKIIPVLSSISFEAIDFNGISSS
jgi:hypothetical protein